MSASSPEELESLLEDAVLLRDGDAVRALYDRRAILVGRGWTGGPDRALDLLASYVPGPVSVVGEVALAVGASVVTISHRGADRRWRVVASITRASPGVRE